MKYIVLTVTQPPKGDESPFVMRYPIVFPNNMVHAHVAKVNSLLLEMMFPKATVTATSAGECNSMAFGGELYGESTSLNVKSKGQEDTNLLKMCDYGAGMVG